MNLLKNLEWLFCGYFSATWSGNVQQERKRKMINNVVLVGRLTRDPELRYTPSNIAITTFNMAVNRNFKNQDGNREADFINCMIWRQQAENFANWCKKGNLVGITGRIQTRSYDNQQGQRVYVTDTNTKILK